MLLVFAPIFKYRSSRQRQNPQPVVTALLSCSDAFFVRPQGLWECFHCWVRHCDGSLEASKRLNYTGSIVNWDEMSLFSLLGSFGGSIQCSCLLIFYNFYIEVFLSLNQNPDMSLGLIATVNQHSHPWLCYQISSL